MDDSGPGRGDDARLEPPEGAHVLDTGAARWWYEPGGLICNQSYVGTVTVGHLRSGFDAARTLRAGRHAALVAETGPLTETSREARAMLAGPEAAELFRAMAVVVRSPVARTIMNFFVRLSSPPFPVRIFTSVAQARSWALEQVRDVPRSHDD